LLGCSDVQEGGINQKLFSENTALKVTQINFTEAIHVGLKQEGLRLNINFSLENTANKPIEILLICLDFNDENTRMARLTLTTPEKHILYSSQIKTYNINVFLANPNPEKVFIEITVYGQKKILGAYKIIAPIPKLKAPKSVWFKFRQNDYANKKAAIRMARFFLIIFHSFDVFSGFGIYLDNIICFNKKGSIYLGAGFKDNGFCRSLGTVAFYSGRSF